jgi:hypothetical protein
MSSTTGDVDLEIHVQAPAWAEYDTIEIYANAATVQDAGSPYLYDATPTMTLVEGDCDYTTAGDGDFDVSISTNLFGVTGADLLETTTTVSFTGLAADTWFVVVVKGTEDVVGLDPCSRPMFPTYPDNLTSASNTTLADLVDGNAGEGGVLALGATNALYFNAAP